MSTEGIRDRKTSGLKAAATNQSKHGADFYTRIAPDGGKAVDPSKRAFSAIRGLASKAAQVRHEVAPTHKVRYLVEPDGYDNYTANSREAARMYKRLLKMDRNISSTITRVEFTDEHTTDMAFIVSKKVVW